MKIRKSYRLSPRTMSALDDLKKMYPEWSETDLIEAAVETFAAEEKRAASESTEAAKQAPKGAAVLT